MTSSPDNPFTPLFSDSKGREVPLPALAGERVADTHAHLDMLDDAALALARAGAAGVAFIATVADVTEEPSRTFEGVTGWRESARVLLDGAGLLDVVVPEVRIIVGAHPHNAKDFSPDAATLLCSLAEDPRVCAIGEVGLDFHYDHSPRDAQRAAFRRQLELAHDLGLPACVHLREAHDEGEAILREAGVPEAGCILHCFGLGAEVAERFLALGCHVSFAGPVTFKRAEDVRASAAAVPSMRLLTETDSPFLAPEPFRGRPCEPGMVPWTAERIAETRREPLPEFAARSLATARGLLGRERT